MTSRPAYFQDGVILLSSLIILMVVTTLILVSMQGGVLYRKTLNAWLEQTEQLDHLEEKATLLLNKSDPECIRNQLNPNRSLALLRQKQGCYFKDGTEAYTYLIENLGIFPCIRMSVGAEIMSTMHRRLSILNTRTQTFLQIRMAYPSALLPCEGHPERFVPQPLLSWRYLPL